MGAYLAGIARQVCEQVELPGGQLYRCPAHRDRSRGDVNENRADGHRRRHRGRIARRRVPERDPEAGLQFLHPEGLGDVVVGATVESEHLALLAVESGKDDHRHVRPLPQPPADLDAVDVGETEVEHDELRRRLRGA